MNAITIRSVKAAHTVLINRLAMSTNFRQTAWRIRLLFFGEEVQKLNQEYKKEKAGRKRTEDIRRISGKTPWLLSFKESQRFSGDVKKYIDLMQTATHFRFNIFDMMSDLIYARVVHPCSKLKTYWEVIPKLFGKHAFSLDQIYSGLEYIGSEYEEVIEIFNHQVALKYPFDTSHSYFRLHELLFRD